MRWSTLRCRWGNPQGWRGGEGYDPGSLRSDSSGFLTAHHGAVFSPSPAASCLTWPLVNSFIIFHPVFTEYLLCAKHCDRG